ncbi:(2Fe-2S)-binding protein [Mitsuokella sp. AF33-22]|uniref:(2Fe-2S)-binding protein n=1 Tax=Mitsuokella sp. AF33-22 TaxID=2292047 RepID=UPI000E47F5B0|nr:(2Fe-2S)-binding protein [Mitsuokella sp. AF33-22]RHM56855.1 (2Fe-2S)-binding protein [Mitsuokella sp. AF33-22]
MKREKIACHCRRVTYGEIVDAVAAGAKTFEEVSARTTCSTGCGKCRDFITHMVEDIQRYPEDYGLPKQEKP